MSALDKKTRDPVKSPMRELTLMRGRFFPNGAAAPVPANSPDRQEALFSVTSRPAVGQYVITVTGGSVPKFVGVSVALAKAVPDPSFTWCEIARSAAAGTITIAVFSAGVAVDYPALATTFFSLQLAVRQTAVGP